MAKFLSGRQKNLKLGVESFSEDKVSLEVIGKVGINSSNPTGTLDVVGDVNVLGSLGISTLSVDNLALGVGASITIAGIAGSDGQYLGATGAGITWATFPNLRTGFSTVGILSQTNIQTLYNINFLDIFVNGVLLDSTEYTASNGIDIIFNEPFLGGENVDIFSYNTVSAYGGGGGGNTIVIGGGGASVTISDTEPESPSDGNLWYDSTIGRGFIYYDDGDSSQWVDFSPATAGLNTTSASGGESYWVSTDVGIHTLSNVGIGTTNPTENLTVVGDARVTGILTVGTSSITLDGNTNAINVGSGITIYGSTGTIEANSIILNGISLVGLASEGYVDAASSYTSEWILELGDNTSYGISGPGLINIENDPTFYLIRGQKYKFTNKTGGHPFRIQSTPNGTVGTQYNDGITNNDAGPNTTLLWDVQFDTPDTLYYQCTAHNDMGGTIRILNVGSNGGGESYWVSTDVGIHTLSNVGIGTTNPQYKLDIGGDINFTGTLYQDGVAFSGGGGGGGESYWVSTDVGIHTLSNVGIGTTNPTSTLTVGGGTSTRELYVTGVSTFRNPLDIFSSISIKTPTDSNIFDISYDTNNDDIRFNWQQSGGTGGSQIIWYIPETSSFVMRNPAVDEKLSEFTTGGSVDLYYNGGKKFETIGYGVSITGNINATGIISATTFYGDLVGSITNATNLTGGTANASSLNVSGIATISQGRIQADAGSNLRFGNLPAGSGSSRNIAIGDQVLVSLNGGSGRNIGIGELSYYDTTSGQYNIGIGVQAGQKITTGSYNVIIGGYDGQTGLDLRTSSNNVVIADGQGNIRQYIDSNGNVGIKTTVVTEALTVAGIVSATSFYGTLNAEQLTGALPAIDGSALVGVVATGSGVEIRDNDSPVGTAATINFGENISVSFASGIATVSTSLVGYATEGYVNNSIVGFITSGALDGYATENYVSTASVSFASTAGISSEVSSTININTIGIITASTFSGSGSGLTNIPSGQLTGALPAIDGSALLNVTASGTGVVVEDNQVNVGSATTIDFGTGLDVAFSAGIATITASGGSLQSRTVVTGTTASLSNNGIGNTNITGFKSYALMRVGLSTAGWLRLYTDSTSRDNDVSRSIGEDPIPGSGVIAEVITTGISTTQIISPFVMGGNLDDPADTTIYAAITNLSGSTQAITANLTILQLEA